MARKCSICGKGPVSGNAISHSNKKTKRKWYPNLQTKRVFENGCFRKIKICTKCLKKGKIETSFSNIL